MLRKVPELRRFLDRNHRIGQFLGRKPVFTEFGAFPVRFACARFSSRYQGRFYICMHITHISRVYALQQHRRPCAVPERRSARLPLGQVSAGIVALGDFEFVARIRLRLR